MSDQQFDMLDFVSYLDSIQDLYPAGIPERLIRDAEVSAPAKRDSHPASLSAVRNTFFVFSPEQQSKEVSSLLEAALTKGLKWKTEDVSQLILQPEDARRLVSSALREKGLFCVLGEEAWNTLGEYSSEFQKYAQGRECQVGLSTFLATHSLAAVCNEMRNGKTTLKKQFWHDLLHFRELAER